MAQIKSTVTADGVAKWRDSSWRRWFRRTDVYIAEYILMLMFFGALLGLLASLWFSFFQLILQDGYSGRLLAQTTAVQLGSLVVLSIVGFWFYARVTGQEMMQPELRQKASRTVFLTIWLIIAVGAFVSLVAGAMTGFVQLLMGNSDAGDLLVGGVLPSLLAAATIGFGIAAIVKHSRRKLSMFVGTVVGVLCVALFIANLTMVLVRKNAEEPVDTSSRCTYSRWVDGECSYSDYLEDSRENRNRYDRSNTRSNDLNSLFN